MTTQMGCNVNFQFFWTPRARLISVYPTVNVRHHPGFIANDKLQLYCLAIAVVIYLEVN